MIWNSDTNLQNQLQLFKRCFFRLYFNEKI